ncbi:MAG: hypothetical protein V4649_09075 [Bacteroidota bacterium]
MRKIIVLLPLILFILCIAGNLYAQQPPPPGTRLVAPVPHVNKYKKRDTIRVNLYLVDTLMRPIPIARAYFHDRIDKEQQKADMADGKADSFLRQKETLQPFILTRAILRDVDKMQVMVENMPANGKDAAEDNQHKLQYLRALWEMMRLYNTDTDPDPFYYRKVVANMHDMLIAANENKLLPFVVANTDVITLNNGKVIFDKHPDVRAYVFTKVGQEDPMMLIKRLDEYANDSFAGEIIAVVARINPSMIFNYAQSTNPLIRTPVHRTQDPFVQAIVQIATKSRAPLKAFPFLNDIYTGRRTLAEIDALADRPDDYFQNLVRLKLENDTVTRSIYTAEMQYRTLKNYVRQMNDLHEEKDNVRFKCIDSLPPASLYFILVYGQDEIYTSSFIGTYRRMMERIKPMTGNEFLASLSYDHFRTFIRMCANYNTLSDFLGSMEDTSRTAVMTRFISNLQLGKEDDLEDAVDVADAFGSIRDSVLSDFLQKKVKENYETSYTQQSKKGMIVYSLLSMLFEGSKISNNDEGAAVASARLKLPPINKVHFRDVADDSGTVYQQVFFYGDDDGKISYESFMSEFKRKSWKVVTEKYWSVITSTSGKKVVIYANLPLKEPEDEDAQDSLGRYLAERNIHPRIIIHRGHSYHLPITLAKLTRDVKIVILGSCGGYHNLALVLDRSPDAHIVSSKQIGAMAINEPIVRALNASLVDGEDVNWITMWQDLDSYFSKRKDLHEKYDDYVPPYKNLGAIFIKAYRQMMVNL